MGRILLIRHGQASVLSDNYDQLSKIGERQSQQLGRHFSKEKMNLHKIYSGPLQRQLKTTQFALEKPLQDGFQLEVLDALKEHEGFQIFKSIITELTESDPKIKQLANLQTSDRKEKIKNYLKMYELISTRWIRDELDYDRSRFESWEVFKMRVANVMQQITKKSIKNKTTVLVSSGGPISVGIGQVLGLSDEKMMHLSWVINNSSISELVFNQQRISLKSFNTLPHLQAQELITLV